ncbi:membrane protein [Streptomyces sp. NRRL S-37]|uniref:membrane protein n=1 Tax=Streptomyces sp. NRRL S-37 TaxID=1463903 RepID=UPI0004C4F8AD|nr:membrane protein [Streptomyces sp. NRRL S-37]
MNTERPDNDDEARTAPGGAPNSGGASGHDRETDSPERREPEAAAPGPGTARPADDAPGAGKADAAASGEAPDGEPASGADETVVGEHRAGGPPSGEGHPDEASPRRRPSLLIASVAAAVLLVGGGGAYLASGAAGGSGDSGGGTTPGANGDATPPPLALDGPSEGAANGIAPGEPNPYGVVYRADGSLPEGPGSAPVYHARGQVTEERVVTLAKALGLEGKPVAEGGSWRIGGKDGSGPTLRVDREAPGSWTFSRNNPGTDNCKGATCSAPSAGGPVVSESVAKRAAAPVLKAVGQDDAKLDAGQITGGRRVVNADPEVGGLPTHGWTTGVVVGAKGEVVGGNGRLAEPVKGDTYPVVSAADALKLLNAAPDAGPGAGIGGCASPVPLEDGRPEPCAPATKPKGDSVTVGDAVFGLASHSVDGRPALVPSWLFEVRPRGAEDAFTVTYPAVAPEFLAPRAESGSGEASPRPTEPGDEPAAAPSTRDVDVEGYTAEGDELTVTFTGGVCADYEATARESGDRVTVRVTETPWPDKVCILIAKQYQRTVRLDAPLGDREVVGTDGEPVPLRKDGARLPAPPAR